MRKLPKSSDSLLVRTDFSDDAAWSALLEHVARENEDGFRAYVTPVNDAHFADVAWAQLRKAIPRNRQGASVLFVVDRLALSSADRPILVVDLDDEHEPFRCTADALWGVENNLNIANMDWEEFAEATDPDGTFQGF